MAQKQARQIVAQNRKARHLYHISDTLEAGLILAGTEVKALRAGHANINDAYAGEQGGALWLFNAYIGEYNAGNRFNHAPRRPRKLLLHAQEVRKLLGTVREKGITLTPLALYFNDRGYAKVVIGLGRGKKQYEKRQDIKTRDWQREQQRWLKEERS